MRQKGQACLPLGNVPSRSFAAQPGTGSRSLVAADGQDDSSREPRLAEDRQDIKRMLAAMLQLLRAGKLDDVLSEFDIELTARVWHLPCL